MSVRWCSPGNVLSNGLPALGDQGSDAPCAAAPGSEDFRSPSVAFKDKKQAEVFKLLIDSIKALMRENKEILWGSMVKQTMQRKKPTFNEEYYGYNTFSDLLEDAQKNDIIKIKKDVKSGSYVITGFAQPTP